MNRPTLKKMVAGMGLALAAMAGSAQAATCGITGSASAAPAVYDPFSPNQLVATQVELSLTRVNGGGGEKTDIVNFYLKSNSTGGDGITVIPRGVVGSVNVAGLNYDIFYDFNETPPVVSPTTLEPSAVNRFLKVYFTGNNKDSDTVKVLFDITLPANLNINASTVLPLDAYFGCSTTGSGAPTQQSGMIANAISFPITVLSALQATYAGSALDFGEIGAVTTTQVQSSPATYVTAPVNYIRVQSSGPFSINLVSGNNYKMTPNGAATANTQMQVGYRLKFLSETRSTANASAINYICPRAGIGVAAEDRLYLQAQLAEGGAGKLPSPTYRDTLTVTIAPLAAGTGSTTPAGADCSTLSGQF